MAAVGRLGTHRGRALSATIPAMFLAVLAASSPIQGQLPAATSWTMEPGGR